MPASSAVRGTLLSIAATCKGFSDSSFFCFRMYFWQSSSVGKRQSLAILRCGEETGMPHTSTHGQDPAPAPPRWPCCAPGLLQFIGAGHDSSEKLSSHLPPDHPKGLSMVFSPSGKPLKSGWYLPVPLPCPPFPRLPESRTQGLLLLESAADMNWGLGVQEGLRRPGGYVHREGRGSNPVRVPVCGPLSLAPGHTLCECQRGTGRGTLPRDSRFLSAFSPAPALWLST